MKPQSFMTLAVLACAGLLAVVTHPAFAGERPSARAQRASAPLKIDGVLDEPDWQRAEAVTDFRLLFAREGEIPAESTVVRVLFDEHRIVFGIWCQSQLPPHASLTPRDQITDGDFIAVHIDPDGDGRHAYIFGINPWGVQLDGILTGDPDFTWDGLWEGEANRSPGGWSAEIAIPFRTLRFREGRATPWRLWVRRELTARNEVASWPLWKQGLAGNIMLQAGDLTGTQGVRSGHSLFVQPYLFSALDEARSFLGDGTASRWERTHRTDAGLDVQAGIGSALALNVTLNPDFSQIEADALLIDLNRRFALQYPEKRPFFLEGGDVFQVPLDMVYTRRVADPNWGFKLTGNAAGVRTGAMFVRDDGGGSLDGSGHGSAADSRQGFFGLARAARDFGEGKSFGILAGAHTQDGHAREGTYTTDTSDKRAWDGSRNGFVAGDGTWKFSERWSWEGQLAYSATRVDTFHVASQPAELHERFDGGTWVSRLFYKSRALNLQLGVRNVEPNFRDELGYFERVGVRYEHVLAERHWDFAGGPLQRVNSNLELFTIHDRGGAVAFSQINPWLDLQWRRNFTFSPGVELADEDWLGRHYHQERAHVFLTDSRWQPLTWNLEAIVGDGIFYGSDDASSFLAWSETWIGSASVRPSSWLTSAISVQRLRVAHRATSGEVIGLWLYGVNTTAQFTRRLSARLYPQYDSDAKHLAINALVSWVEHPGTVFYLGVNGGFDRVAGLPRAHATSRQVFMKASYRFEL